MIDVIGPALGLASGDVLAGLHRRLPCARLFPTLPMSGNRKQSQVKPDCGEHDESPVNSHRGG